MWDNAHLWTGIACVLAGIGTLGLGVRKLLDEQGVEDRRQHALRFVGAALSGVVLGIVAIWVYLPPEEWARVAEVVRRIF